MISIIHSKYLDVLRTVVRHIVLKVFAFAQLFHGRIVGSVFGGQGIVELQFACRIVEYFGYLLSRRNAVPSALYLT